MPGLFGTETPEEVRSRIGRTGREQDLNLAQLPAGRGQVALASQLGRGVAQGGAQLLGAPSPAQKQGDKNKLIQESIAKIATTKGVTKDDNPVEYLAITSQVLAQNGETQAAANALNFATKVDELSKLEATALEKNIRQIFKLGRNDPLTDNARVMMARILQLQSTPSSSGLIPTDTSASITDLKKSTTFVKNAISADTPLELTTEGGSTNTFTSKDFLSEENRKAFNLAHAERVRTLKNENKQRGNPPLDTNKLNKQVLEEMKQFLEVKNDDDFIPFNEKIFFNAGRASSTATVKQLTQEIANDVAPIVDIETLN